MPITHRPNYKTATAFLAPIYEVIQSELQTDLNFQITGKTALYALYGIPYDTIETAGLSWPEIMITTKFGIFKVVDVTNTRFWEAEHISFGKLYNTFKWFNPAAEPKVSLNPLKLRYNRNIRDYKAALNSGLEISQKLGWTIHPDSLWKLNHYADADRPLEKVEVLISGFRAYNIDKGLLHGGYGYPWATNELTVDCPKFREHIKAPTNVHNCGIYILKDPQAAFEYNMGNVFKVITQVVGGGAFWEGEKGYRVEQCRIEKVWGTKETLELLSKHYQFPAGIEIINTQQDFLKSIGYKGVRIG